MTRKAYELIVRVLYNELLKAEERGIYEAEQLVIMGVVDSLANELEKTNPQFDGVSFIDWVKKGE